MKLKAMTTIQLTEQFRELTLAQFEASESGYTTKYNRLFREMQDVIGELKSRSGGQIRSLMSLHQDANPQVRFMAAVATKDIDPEATRRVCELIDQRNEYPPAPDARQMLRQLGGGGRT